MLDSSRPPQKLLGLLVSGALAIFLLLYFRPYHGIRHDSVLYLGQALLRWRPYLFGQDLFFAFGSQADFTILPRLVASLFDYFGPAEIFLWATLLGRLLFLLASWALLRQILPAPYRYWGLVALLILPGNYGGNSVFSYGEPFFTGRSLAEPLILLALAAWWRVRRGIAASLWILAASIHLLQALPALVVFWIDLVRKDRRWLHLLWMAVPAFAAAALDVAPFAKWLAPYDPQWLAWIDQVNDHCFMTRWQLSDWCYLAVDIYLAVLVLRHSKNILRSIAQAVLSAAVCGIAASLVLVDLWHLVLPTGLQLWRAQWLLHWLAMACVPWLLVRQYWEGGGYDDIRLWLLIALVAMGVPVGPKPLAPYVVLFLIPLHFGWPRLREKISPFLQKVFVATLLLVVLGSIAKLTLTIVEIYRQLPDTRDVFRPEAVLLSHPLLAGGILLGLFFLWQQRKGLRLVLAGLLMGLAAYAATAWDHRNPWTQRIESAQYDQNVFGVTLEPDVQVFWDGELLAPWLILNRPSYMSSLQNAGLLFNRGTAQEARRRLDSLHLYNFQRELCQVVNAMNNRDESCVPDDEAIAEICRGSQGQLGYVILSGQLKTPAYGIWNVAGGIRGDRSIAYRLYRCKDFDPLPQAQAAGKA